MIMRGNGTAVSVNGQCLNDELLISDTERKFIGIIQCIKDNVVFLVVTDREWVYYIDRNDPRSVARHVLYKFLSLLSHIWRCIAQCLRIRDHYRCILTQIHNIALIVQVKSNRALAWCDGLQILTW